MPPREIASRSRLQLAVRPPGTYRDPITRSAAARPSSSAGSRSGRVRQVGVHLDQGVVAPLQPQANPARECLSSLFGGGASAYERTAARGAFTRAITGDGNEGVILLDEAMSTFESTAAASQLVARVVGQWFGCAGKSVTLIVDGNPLTLDVGEPIQKGTVMVLRNTLRNGTAGFSSDRAIAAKANVVIDLDAEGFDLGDSLEIDCPPDPGAGAELSRESVADRVHQAAVAARSPPEPNAIAQGDDQPYPGPAAARPEGQ